jgi:hypothetical protein
VPSHFNWPLTRTIRVRCLVIHQFSCRNKPRALPCRSSTIHHSPRHSDTLSSLGGQYFLRQYFIHAHPSLVAVWIVRRVTSTPQYAASSCTTSPVAHPCFGTRLGAPVFGPPMVTCVPVLTSCGNTGLNSLLKLRAEIGKRTAARDGSNVC